MPVKPGRVGRLARLGGMAAGLAGDAAAGLASRGSAAAHRQAAARIALVLGELKGLPHKVGQVLSILDEALPAEHRQVYAEVLGRLQAHARPLPWEELVPVVAADLGRDPAAVFARVDPEPAAAASIGQVHRATLWDGRAVALKVQYPGVAEALEDDLANVGALVGALSAVLPRGSVEPLVRDVVARFREELDYGHEAEVQVAFAARWRGDPSIVVPEVLPELSGPRVLVSAWIEGLDFAAATAAREDERGAWGAALWRFTWQGALAHGWLHGDPHPGNFLFLPGGRVAVLDYGCTQALPDETVAGLREVMRGAMEGASAEALLPPLQRTLDLPEALDPALIPSLAAFAADLVSPVSSAQPFTFDRAYMERLMAGGFHAKQVMARRALVHGVPTPQARGAVLLMRVCIGMAAVLSRLGARADFRAALRA